MIRNDPSLAKYLKKHNVRAVGFEPKDSNDSRKSLNTS